jgi:hypothetical protein
MAGQPCKYIILGSWWLGVINAGSWVRNTLTYGFPLGPRQAIAALSNDTLSPGILAFQLDPQLHAAPGDTLRGRQWACP